MLPCSPNKDLAISQKGNKKAAPLGGSLVMGCFVSTRETKVWFSLRSIACVYHSKKKKEGNKNIVCAIFAKFCELSVFLRLAYLSETNK